MGVFLAIHRGIAIFIWGVFNHKLWWGLIISMLFIRKKQKYFFLLLIMVAMLTNVVGEQSSCDVPIDEARLAPFMAKYAHFIDYQPDEHIKSVLLDADRCVERYTNENFLDHIVNAEEYRQKEQLAFNNKVLYSLDVPWGDQQLSLALRNSDLGKILFVGLEWGIEWQIYSSILSWWTDFVAASLLQHRSEYIDALQAVQDNLENGNDQALKDSVSHVHDLVYAARCKDTMMHLTRDLLPVVATYLCLGHAFELLKKYYLLDRSHAQNILMLAATSLLGLNKLNTQDPISIFDLIEGNWMMGMPLTILRTGILDQVNGFLQRCGILPAWSSSSMFLFARRVAFWLLFMRWSISSFLQPKLFEYVMNNRHEILTLLRESSDVSGVGVDRTALKKIIKNCYPTMFPQWLAFKAEKYSAWQTIINVVIMTPAAVSLARKIYTMIQQFNDKNAAGEKIPAGVDNDGTL